MFLLRKTYPGLPSEVHHDDRALTYFFTAPDDQAGPSLKRILMIPNAYVYFNVGRSFAAFVKRRFRMDMGTRQLADYFHGYKSKDNQRWQKNMSEFWSDISWMKAWPLGERLVIWAYFKALRFGMFFMWRVVDLTILWRGWRGRYLYDSGWFSIWKAKFWTKGPLLQPPLVYPHDSTASGSA